MTNLQLLLVYIVTVPHVVSFAFTQNCHFSNLTENLSLTGFSGLTVVLFVFSATIYAHETVD